MKLGKIVDQINDSSTKNFCRENQFEEGVFVINQTDKFAPYLAKFLAYTTKKLTSCTDYGEEW